MSGSIDGTGIDKVLREAVDSGGVPHVAAIAADRDGVIYQGAAGPRAAGESDPVTVDTLFRIMSMTKMPCTVARLQQVEQGNRPGRAGRARCPECAGLQVLTGWTGTASDNDMVGGLVVSVADHSMLLTGGFVRPRTWLTAVRTARPAAAHEWTCLHWTSSDVSSSPL